MANCPNCGAALQEAMTRCAKCGATVAAAAAAAPQAAGAGTPGMVQPKSPPARPVVGLILNLILGGVGYFYIGQMGKGILFLATWFVFWFLTVVTCGLLGIVLIPLAILLELFTAVDVFIVAKKLAGGQAVASWRFF